MQTDWVDWLPVTEFAYNNHEHSATGYSPFYLKYSRHPFVPTAPWKVLIDNPSAEDLLIPLVELSSMCMMLCAMLLSQ
jgi:hypothetical protein